MKTGVQGKGEEEEEEEKNLTHPQTRQGKHLGLLEDLTFLPSSRLFFVLGQGHVGCRAGLVWASECHSEDERSIEKSDQTRTKLAPSLSPPQPPRQREARPPTSTSPASGKGRGRTAGDARGAPPSA